VEIPKNGGGVRKLGIPSVLDRFLQQSILQVLQPMFDPTFSEHSHGFRPGRKAHDAVCEAQRYIQEGKREGTDGKITCSVSPYPDQQWFVATRKRNVLNFALGR
jgi:retron-type reverse transcriptase